jgi:anti-sigma factor RsiW
MNCAEAQTFLDAYLDSELGFERSLEFERHCATCSSCAAELDDRRALGVALREKIDYHMAPLDLHRSIRRKLAASGGAPLPGRSGLRSALAGWTRIAASLVLVAGLSSAVTYYATPRGGDTVPDEVFASHVRGMLSEDRRIDIASSDRHTVKPWLDAKLDFAPPVKDLSSDGFPLVGGRIDYINGRMVAALVYRHNKHVITLFIWPGDGSTRPIATSARRGDNLADWSDGAMTYWAISDVAAAELMRFCRRFQVQEPAPERPAPGPAENP